MSTEKMREEFEAWICGIWPGVSISRNPDNAAMFSGSYRNERVHMAWKGWQASRAAIEVELPEIKGFEGAYDSYKQNEFVPFMTDVDDADEIFGLMRGIEVREAIESLGLKVKP